MANTPTGTIQPDNYVAGAADSNPMSPDYHDPKYVNVVLRGVSVEPEISLYCDIL